VPAGGAGAGSCKAGGRLDSLGANRAFAHPTRRGSAWLAETGFVAGRNLTFEYHSVNYRLDRMSGVAAELVRRRVSVLGAGALVAALAAKDVLVNPTAL
jgi:hypothetical protein